VFLRLKTGGADNFPVPADPEKKEEKEDERSAKMQLQLCKGLYYSETWKEISHMHNIT